MYVCVPGSQILLKDTSFMPDIPGLPALITMLFTPIMELRSVSQSVRQSDTLQCSRCKTYVNIFSSFFCSTDEERTCYTGALCGLGWNSQTQEGVLPEHDIELTFDVKFDVEDITEVRQICCYWSDKVGNPGLL